jgi:hypothetical protein
VKKILHVTSDSISLNIQQTVSVEALEQLVIRKILQINFIFPVLKVTLVILHHKWVGGLQIIHVTHSHRYADAKTVPLPAVAPRGNIMFNL